MLRKRVFQGVNQGSASGTGSPGSRSPGPGNLGPGLGPGLKFKICGIWDWDRDASKNPGPEPGLTIFSSGTEILSNPGCVPNSKGNFFNHENK